MHIRIVVCAGFLRLSLLHLLRLNILALAFSFLRELLVFILNLGCPVFRFSTTAGTSSVVCQLIGPSRRRGNDDLRQFNVNPARGVFAVIERRVMIELQTGLHTVVVVELDEPESARFRGLVWLRSHPHGYRLYLLEVCF